MKSKTLVLIACLGILSCSAIWGVSYINTSGSVHSLTTNSNGVVTHLKIYSTDSEGAVNASCGYSDSVSCECQTARVGYLAQGIAKCVSGSCQWISLETSALGGDVDCGN